MSPYFKDVVQALLETVRDWGGGWGAPDGWQGCGRVALRTA